MEHERVLELVKKHATKELTIADIETLVELADALAIKYETDEQVRQNVATRLGMNPHVTWSAIVDEVMAKQPSGPIESEPKSASGFTEKDLKIIGRMTAGKSHVAFILDGTKLRALVPGPRLLGKEFDAADDHPGKFTLVNGDSWRMSGPYQGWRNFDDHELSIIHSARATATRYTIQFDWADGQGHEVGNATDVRSHQVFRQNIESLALLFLCRIMSEEDSET